MSKKGERKKIYRTQKHLRINVSGMCCPETGEFFALEFPYTNKDAFQAFLNTANREIDSAKNKKDIIVLDNASWHKCKGLNWGRFEPLYLPPYSPDFNHIERIWGFLKEQFFNTFCARDLNALITQLDFALCFLWKNGDIVTSITKKHES